LPREVFWLKRHGADAVVRATDIPLRTHVAASPGIIPKVDFFCVGSGIELAGDFSLDNSIGVP